MIRGELEAFFETGTEGVYWAMIDPALPGYDGLWSLEAGDRLRVIDTDDTVLWDGVIQLEYKRNWEPYPRNPEYGQQAVLGYWVHGLQEGVDPDQWAGMFFARHRALLELGPNQQPRSHPFDGPSAELEARLRALSEDAQYRIYCETMYPWLYFTSNGNHYSFLQEWDFSLEEIITVVGVSEEQVEVAKRQYVNPLIPFNWATFVRLALLFGVRGALKWRFPHGEEGIAWLNEGSPSPKALLLQGDVLQVRNLLTVQ